MAMMYKISGNYKKLFKKYVSKYYPGEENIILAKTNQIYNDFKMEVPDIGGNKNMLASNLDMALAFFAFYEASDKRITGESILEIAGWMWGSKAFASKIVNFNKPWMAKLMYKMYIPYAKKVEKHKANGEWGNAWGIKINPENFEEGCSFHLIGCPLVDFAKKHGYMELMPYMCETDHMSAKLMNAKLLRNHTVAEGAESCDYWYVGNQSSAIKPL